MTEFESCMKCKHFNVDAREYPCYECTHGVSVADHFEPMSNADKIRSMTDKGLADFLDNVFNNIFDGYEFPCEHCTERINCDVCFNEWLQKESEE